jgi:hypothetical protein
MARNLITTLGILVSLIFLSTGSTLASPGRLNHITEIARLDGGEHNQTFGYSMAISGDTLAVGDPYDSRAGDQAGSVTIFQPNPQGQWVEVTTLIALEARQGDHFGADIAISGERLLVGAPFSSDFGNSPGSAYIFERNQGGPNAWGQVAKLVADEVYPWDNFGWAVSLQGNQAVVGAYTTTPGGAVYVFERDAGGSDTWEETAQLLPDAPGYQACFGEALDLDGDLLAIGAYGGGDYSGYVYIFQYMADSSQWQRLTRFRAADTAPYHYFGYTVALDDYTVLAGAPGADGLTGVAYIFTTEPEKPDTWTERARLVPSDGTMGDMFAQHVDLSGEYAWIGSPWHAADAGAAYLFDRDQGGIDHWGEVAHLIGSNTMPGDAFGYWISTDGTLAVAGAPTHSPGGAAYIFDLHAPWLTHLPLVIR